MSVVPVSTRSAIYAFELGEIFAPREHVGGLDAVPAQGARGVLIGADAKRIGRLHREHVGDRLKLLRDLDIAQPPSQPVGLPRHPFRTPAVFGE
jgi:hypothetical protein